MKVIDIRIKVPVRDTESDPYPETPNEYARYGDVYHNGGSSRATLDELVTELETFDVAPSVLQAEHEFGRPQDWNDRVSELLRRHPERFVCGWGIVDPRRPMEAVKEIDRIYHELGLRGVIFEPGFLDISPTDARCYPVYAKCVELGIPVGLHTGVNFSSHGPLRHERPFLVDQVACHFNDLILVCHHGGWPWAHEMVAVAWKHPNVYLEFGAIAPAYIASGGGWGDVPRFMDSLLHEQILFGTDWPMMRYERVLEEVEKLGLRERSLSAYLGGNAERLLDRIL